MRAVDMYKEVFGVNDEDSSSRFDKLEERLGRLEVMMGQLLELQRGGGVTTAKKRVAPRPPDGPGSRRAQRARPTPKVPLHRRRAGSTHAVCGMANTGLGLVALVHVHVHVHFTPCALALCHVARRQALPPLQVPPPLPQ